MPEEINQGNSRHVMNTVNAIEKIATPNPAILSTHLSEDKDKTEE